MTFLRGSRDRMLRLAMTTHILKSLEKVIFYTVFIQNVETLTAVNFPNQKRNKIVTDEV